MMPPRPFLLLLAGFALALMAAGEADAKEPFGNYTTEGIVYSVAISADGEYIAAGTWDYNVYLFDKAGDGDNVTVTDVEEDEEGIPTLSVITTMAAVAIMALRRRPE